MLCYGIFRSNQISLDVMHVQRHVGSLDFYVCNLSVKSRRMGLKAC